MRSVVIPVGRLAAGALGLLLALTPLVATAQAGMDPAVRATAEMAVVAVGRVVRPATVAAGAPLVANLPNLLPTPTPPPAPPLAPAAPSFDVTAATAYESAGVTVAVPAGWTWRAMTSPACSSILQSPTPTSSLRYTTAAAKRPVWRRW